MDGSSQPQALALGDIGVSQTRTRVGRRGARVEAEPGPAASAAIPFEEGLAELERIVAALEAGDLGLDAALSLYERGVGLVRDCTAQLDAAEARIKTLSLDENGRPIVEPMEEAGA